MEVEMKSMKGVGVLQVGLSGVVRYGYFDDERNEFVITTPMTPRPWENRIWNDSLNLQISNHGNGMSYGKDGRGKFVLFNYRSPNRCMYVLDKTSGKLWSPGYWPVNEELDFYEVRHGLKYTMFKARKDGVELSWCVTVHSEDCAELWRVELKNTSRKARKLQLAPFYQVDLSLKDPYFGAVNLYKSYVSARESLIYVKNCAYIRKGEDDALALYCDRSFRKFEMNTGEFLKGFSSLSRPGSVVRDKWSNSLIDDDNDPCLAAGLDISLAPGKSYVANFAIYTAEDLESAERKADEYSGGRAYESALATHAGYAGKMLSMNSIRTKDKIFDRYANVWIKHQFWYNAEWNRGWGMGFRDSMSDCDMFRMFQPSGVRRRLQQAASHIYEDGLTVRSYFPAIEKPYFDGGVWFQNTLSQYIRETGDWSILDEKAPFYKSGRTGTVLEHAKRTVEFLDKQRGPDNICRMGFGDWNDALGGIDREGRGQSVWTTMAYIFGLRGMASLLGRINDADSEVYLARAEELTGILNAKFFDVDRYVRAVTDAGRLVGCRKDKEGRLFIEPQGWSLFTGVADARKAKKIVAAMRRELYVPYGAMLLSPPFTKYREDVGRISNDPPGLVENGSNYVQGMLFYTYGLVRAGMPDEAYGLLHRVLPTNLDNPPEKAVIEPYQITNSFQGPASKHPGRAMFGWRTGSAGWFLKTVWDGMLGIRPDFDELEIEAKLPEAWGARVSASRNIRGSSLLFEFAKAGSESRGRSFDLRVGNGSRIPYERLRDVSSVLVEL